MTLIVGDCLDVLAGMEDKSVDLVFTSPPYEAARTYGIGFNLRGQDWVEWMVERCREMARVCRGVVCVNCEGQTRNFSYSGVPFLLFADLKRAGFAMRKPPAFARKGIPGSGGPDWLRNDYEPIICFQSQAEKLPWSDNTAIGHPPKYGPGGEMSNRKSNGERVNQCGNVGAVKGGCASVPILANPGNIIRCVVGGGAMGSPYAHENEAPFPEKLAEFFIRSFCPPGGVVLDPFVGSGTVPAVAVKTGRKFIGIDIRESQIQICKRRLNQVQTELFT